MDGFQTIESIQGAITVYADEFSNYRNMFQLHQYHLLYLVFRSFSMK
jgi:hypothetical protein